MELLTVGVVYFISVILTYIIIRHRCIKENLKPTGYDLFLVIVPIFNTCYVCAMLLVCFGNYLVNNHLKLNYSKIFLLHIRKKIPKN
jgi:membrane-bound acyltransferase YfiQ involved in biofilm formation